MLHVRVKAQEAIKKIKGFEKQIPYATARALTKSAKDVQVKLVNVTKERFNIRKPWIDKGKYSIRVTPATKQTLTAKVWNDAPFMEKQEEGGMRKPSGKLFAIPTDRVKRNSKDLVTSANKPRNINNAFFADSRTNPGLVLFMKRIGKKAARVMYLMVKKVKIPKRWGFVENGLLEFQKVYEKNFMESIDEAIKSAK